MTEFWAAVSSSLVGWMGARHEKAPRLRPELIQKAMAALLKHDSHGRSALGCGVSAAMK